MLSAKMEYLVFIYEKLFIFVDYGKHFNVMIHICPTGQNQYLSLAHAFMVSHADEHDLCS